MSSDADGLEHTGGPTTMGFSRGSSGTSDSLTIAIAIDQEDEGERYLWGGNDDTMTTKSLFSLASQVCVTSSSSL